MSNNEFFPWLLGEDDPEYRPEMEDPTKRPRHIERQEIQIEYPDRCTQCGRKLGPTDLLDYICDPCRGGQTRIDA